MYTERKFKILIWLVVVLALTNVSTIATIWWMRSGDNTSEAAFFPKKDRDGHRRGGKGEYWFAKRLALDDKQATQFKQHTRWFREEARLLAERMNQFREEMIVEMANEKPDTLKLNNLSVQIGNNHAQLKKLTYQYFVKLKAECKADQINELEKSFRQMMQQDGDSRPRGFKRMMGNPRGNEGVIKTPCKDRVVEK